MASKGTEQDSIFIKEVEGHQKRHRKLIQFTSSSTKAAAVMLLAAVISIIVANTAGYGPFAEFWATEIGFVGGGSEITMSLGHIIQDILMAVFFLLIGLEIKYEMTVGELTNIRQAILPIVAALGGVLAPIVIYSIFNAGNPETAHGWGIPTATDIAFALGIMALLGNRVPNGVRVFLTTLAVADDIVAILIIAIFYGQSPSFFWLAMVAVVMVVLVVLNRSNVYSLTPYIILGVLLWYCVFMSGVHSTIAGVLLALTIPAGSRVDLKSFSLWSEKKIHEAEEQFSPEDHVMGQGDYLHTVTELSNVAKEVVPPATRLEHKLYPWVYFAILPLFALTNADVRFVGGELGNIWADPALYGVFFGLLLGKPIGIMLFSWLVTKFKWATLPENVNWMHMLGASILGGVGFTMAIFVANLAFTDPAIITTAKLAILSASLLAGILGFTVLWLQARKDKARGVSYLTTHDDDMPRQTAGAEAAQNSKELLERLDSPLLNEEIEAATKECGVAEVVLDLGADDTLSFGEEASAEGETK